MHKLLACRLAPGALWASKQDDPSSAVDDDAAAAPPYPLPPLDASLSLADFVRSALLRSPLAHLYEMHQLLTALVSSSISVTSSPSPSPSSSVTTAYVPYRRLLQGSTINPTTHNNDNDDDDDDDNGGGGGGHALKGLPEGFQVQTIGRVELGSDGGGSDVTQLALKCLFLVGLGIGSGFSLGQ